MFTAQMIKTNRFWQQRQRFDFAQNKREHIETDRSPQAGGSDAA